MTDSYLLNPVVFLVQTLFGLYCAVVALRFLLQWVRADFYNPLSQFVVKVTTPVLRPLRKVIPGYGGLDLAALVLLWVLTSIQLAILALLTGVSSPVFLAVGWAIPDMVELFINIFLFGILIRVILSWVNPDPYNPANAMLDKLTDPIMRPARRLIRPIGGIDLSPMVAMMGLVLLNMLLIPPLKWLVASPFRMM